MSTTHTNFVLGALTLSILGLLLSINVALAHDDGTDHPHTEVDASVNVSVESLPVDVILDPKTGRPLPANEAKRYLDAKTKAQNVQNQIKETRTDVKVKTDAVQERVKDIRVNTTQRIEDVRAEVKTRVGNATTSVKQRFEEQRAKISAAAYERAKAYLERVIRQLGAAHERLVRIADRFEERITKLNEMGATTTEAEAGLVTARTKLLEAEASIELAAEALAAAPTTTTPDTAENDRVKLGEVRDLVKAAQDALKAARASLRTLLELVRAAAETLPDTVEASAALEI
jgi:exonuclease VII small subunit